MTDQNMSGDPGNKDDTPSFSSQADQQSKKQDEINIEDVLKRDRHAQEHIRKLEAERKADRDRIAALEQDLAKAKTIDDLMSWRKQDSYTDMNEPTSRDNVSQIDVDALVTAAEQRVLESLSAKERESREMNNYQSVLNALKEKHGEHVDSKVANRAQELGMSIPDMVGVARRSPRAFFELMGEKEIKTPASTFGGNTNLKGSSEPGVDDMLRLMKDKDPAARKTWQDPEYQRRLRLKILEEYRKKQLPQG